MTDQSQTIGFIGLGVMGKPMSLNLLKAGHRLMVFDIRSGPVSELVEAGAQDGVTISNIGAKCSIVFTMLPDSPEVEEVIGGDGGVLSSMEAGGTIVDMSSIAPGVARKMHGLAREKEIEMLDAPVSGGEPKAISGELSIMVGGAPEVFEKLSPLLSVMGASVRRVGEIGSGNVCKLANQIMVAIHLASVSEAMVFAEKAGVDPGEVFHAIRGGLAGSAVMDAKMPLILERNFKPGGPIRMHKKDLTNVYETAREIDAPIPLTSQVMEFMKALINDGKGEDDHCGIIQFHEMLAGVTVKHRD